MLNMDAANQSLLSPWLLQFFFLGQKSVNLRLFLFFSEALLKYVNVKSKSNVREYSFIFVYRPIYRILHGCEKIWILCSSGKNNIPRVSVEKEVRYCSCHENLKSISLSCRVMFFLLYGHFECSSKRQQ